MKSRFQQDDRRYMAAALRLAQRGLGRCWPNPSVGALLVDKNGVVAGTGTTARGGRPHAETIAIADAGPAGVGGTLYVSLEPCAHQGETPPCCTAIIAAGIRRVVCPISDPDSRVAGTGFRILREAGVEVTTGLFADRAETITAGHITRVSVGKPHVQLKLAVSSDGYIGKPGAGQVAITGEATRAFVHRMRATSDAIMVGIGTIQADAPDLRCRLPGCGDLSPVRVVLDSNLSLLPASRLAETANETPVWVYTAADVNSGGRAQLSEKGIEIVQTEVKNDNFLDLDKVLGSLADRGITRLMVEGGACLAKSLVERDLVDEFVVVTGPSKIGRDGVLAFQDQGVEAITRSSRFFLAEARELGEDRMQIYRKRSA